MSEPKATPRFLKLVEYFIGLRAAIDALETEFDAKVKPFKDKLKEVEARLEATVSEAGASSIKTPLGTVVLSTRYTASLSDPDAFMKFVIANNKFELLDRRASSTAVKDYVGETSLLPPGCNLNAITKLSVRKV